MPGRLAFPRRERLTKRAEIVRVLRGGRRCRTELLEAFLARSNGTGPRVAVIVPRYGHTAVERNRLRRRLRELVRTGWLPGARASGQSAELVIRARAEAYGASFAALAADFERAVSGLE